MHRNFKIYINLYIGSETFCSLKKRNREVSSRAQKWKCWYE